MNLQISKRYNILDTIGAGGMGTVYKAYDRLTKETIALKHVVVAQKQAEDGTTILPHNHKLTLANEFRTLASLRHPHIISVLDYGFDAQQHPYFTMTVLEDAETILVAGRDEPLMQQVNLINQMLLALVYLHQRGIIHRDLKPANVLVTAGQVKVLDFGLSVASNQSAGRAGTLAYMAPETLRMKTSVTASDLYSVGVMMHEIFTGELPYDPADIVTRVSEGVSSDKMQGHPLEDVVMQLLQINPDDRPKSATAVIEAICGTLQSQLPEETKAIRDGFIQSAPFVGRDAELRQLETALEAALQAGGGSIWLVGGESGVGKSRLVDEVRIRAVVSGVLSIQGQAVTEGGLPFQIWRPIIRRLILSSELDDLQARILKELVPDISDLLGYDVPDAPSLTGKSYVRRLAHAVEDLMAQQKTTTLLILEDLQWADESLLLLQHLMTAMAKLPKLMVVGTFREEEYPTLPQEFPAAHTISLKRLDEAAIAQLTIAMLGEENNRDDIIALLQRETQGNTFFMVEVVRTLAEEAGKLADIGRITLPQNVFTGRMKEILLRRVQQLPANYQPILNLAAVVGRQIEPDILRTAFPDVDIDVWLYACDMLSIIMVQRNQWLFAHDKIREAVLQELSETASKALHQQAAEAIETVSENVEEHAEVLLEHWHIAGNLEKEIDYLKQIAPRLIHNTGEYAKAQTVLKRAMTALPHDDPRHVPLLNFQAECHWQSGQIDDAWMAAEDALQRAEAQDDISGTAHARLNLGDVMRVKADYEQAHTYYESSSKLYEQVGDEQGLATCLLRIGDTYARRADYQSAKVYLEGALKHYRMLNYLRGIAKSLEDLALIHRVNRELEQALSLSQEALSIARQLGDQRNTALMLNSLGRVYRDLEQYTEAEDYLNQSLVLIEELGDEFGTAWTRYNVGLIAYKREDYGYAELITRAALDTYEKLDDKYAISLCNTSLGHIRLAQKKAADAITYLYIALQHADLINVPPLGLIAMIGFARIEHERGAHDRVRNILHLASHHPATNTEVYFRLNDLTGDLATLVTTVEQDKSSPVDYVEMVTNLLVDYAPDNAEV